MPRSGLGFASAPKVEVLIDMGNPLLNRIVNSFLKIGTVAAMSIAAKETFHCINKGSILKTKVEDALKRMCKEGAYLGSVAGVYVGTEYGVERVRGTRDWKNAMLSGVIMGELVSAISKKNKDHVVVDAIRGGAIPIAAEFINYLT